MKPIKFTQSNMKFVAEGCEDLPAFKGEGRIISCWELDGDDLMRILETKCLWVHVTGTKQPAMMLSVEQPFAGES